MYPASANRLSLPEEEGLVAGHALRLVDGAGVAVAEVARLQIVLRHLDLAPAVEVDDETPIPDAGDDFPCPR